LSIRHYVSVFQYEIRSKQYQIKDRFLKENEKKQHLSFSLFTISLGIPEQDLKHLKVLSTWILEAVKALTEKKSPATNEHF